MGCVGMQQPAEQDIATVPLGLYKVVGRECSYAENAPEDCSWTQYIELVKGVFYGIGKDEVAFTTWLAETPSEQHDYIARNIRHGSFVNANEFVIEDNEHGKEWFIVENGVITEYYFVRHSWQVPRGTPGKTHLSLKSVQRNAELDRLLSYPPSER
jgi:hypothetical protein